jgi:predicted Rossmann-fold nucleotide-binding protein
MSEQKNLIIAGGRNFRMNRQDIRRLCSLVADHGYTAVISGGASGADLCGEVFAYCLDLPLIIVDADWNKHGKAAGPIRNKEIAKIGHGLAIFTGGSGTNSMNFEALKAGIKIHDFRL